MYLRLRFLQVLLVRFPSLLVSNTVILLSAIIKSLEITYEKSQLWTCHKINTIRIKNTWIKRRFSKYFLWFRQYFFLKKKVLKCYQNSYWFEENISRKLFWVGKSSDIGKKNLKHLLLIRPYFGEHWHRIENVNHHSKRSLNKYSIPT